MQHTEDVLFEERKGQGGDLGIITLNRPQVLNSLNYAMIVALSQQLEIWKNAPHIKAVVITSVPGRAFCAGGDLRQTYECMKNRDMKMTDFFRDEYQLNRQIFHFPKPYIAILNGITMGGGAGISIHGSHRVATNNLLFAMPETGIGFFPDVGGTYFLPRLKHGLGAYLGLSGARIGSDDCVTVGIATHKIDESSLEQCIAALGEQHYAGEANQAVTQILEQFSVDIHSSKLLEVSKELKTCFNHSSIPAIFSALAASKLALCHETLANLQKKSPLSLAITLQALDNARTMDFDACMQQEYRLVSRFLLGHDFLEGIRALIIDKDQAPQWKPAKQEEIQPSDIAPYFSPLSAELL